MIERPGAAAHLVRELVGVALVHGLGGEQELLAVDGRHGESGVLLRNKWKKSVLQHLQRLSISHTELESLGLSGRGEAHLHFGSAIDQQEGGQTPGCPGVCTPVREGARGRRAGHLRGYREGERRGWQR
jgi:hypothetical protein